MSNPVAASQSTPLFGGLSGYRRDAPGKPTSVPGSAPAFRGVGNKPGQPVKAPGIRTSYNRGDRGSNVVIPYARVVPLEHLRDVGRVSPGDVVFAARTKLTPHGYGMQTQMRLVGVDWLNRQLGGRPEYDRSHKTGMDRFSHLWQVGYNVLLGTPAGASGSNGAADRLLIGNVIADEWRGLTVFQEWCCDGVVLSNDQPNAHNSSGERDGQLFNIAVQGMCPVNNGYVDFRGKGVESGHRGNGADKHGYYDGGEPMVHHDFASAFGGPYYNSYPLQMFDRKLRPMNDVYVGLVCTRRRLSPYDDGSDEHARYRDQLKANATTQAEKDAVDAAVYFYTFHYAYFSSNQAFGYDAPDPQNPYESNPSLTEPRSKRARKHYEEAGGGEYDAYIGISTREFEGLVGAWRVGKVLDIAASKKDQYYGGPTDTADRITVNVDVEWKDWRQLRRDFGRGDIGKNIPGAYVWGEVDGAGDPTNAAEFPIGQFPQDEGYILRWPTEYVSVVKGRRINGVNNNEGSYGTSYTPNRNPANQPIDPMTIDEAARIFENDKLDPDRDYQNAINPFNRRKKLADEKVLAGIKTYGKHGLGMLPTSTYSASGTEMGAGRRAGLEEPQTDAGGTVLPGPNPLIDYRQGQMYEEVHEYSTLRERARMENVYGFDVTVNVNRGAPRPAVAPTRLVPQPARYGLAGEKEDDQGIFQPADVQAPAPGGSGTVADVVMAPAKPAGKGKAKATGAAAAAAAAAPTKKRAAPAATVTPTPTPAPTAAAAAPVPALAAANAGVTVAAALSKSPAASPAASPSLATAAATTTAAAPPQPRGTARRGRAGEAAGADVFASIFGGDAAGTTSSAAAQPSASVQPSPSEGSDGASAARGDGRRVRRNRDGR